MAANWQHHAILSLLCILAFLVNFRQSGLWLSKSFSSTVIFTMAPKTKTRNTTIPQLHRERGKQNGWRRAQSPPDLPPATLEALSADEDDEPSLRNVMTILVDISSRLSANKKKVEPLAAHTDTQNHITAVASPSKCLLCHQWHHWPRGLPCGWRGSPGLCRNLH